MPEKLSLLFSHIRLFSLEVLCDGSKYYGKIDFQPLDLWDLLIENKKQRQKMAGDEKLFFSSSFFLAFWLVLMGGLLVSKTWRHSRWQHWHFRRHTGNAYSSHFYISNQNQGFLFFLLIYRIGMFYWGTVWTNFIRSNTSFPRMLEKRMKLIMLC